MLIDMHREEQWARLIERLDAWTSASSSAGRIRVSVPNASPVRWVEIVMTPTQWDDMASVGWGDVDEAIEEVKRRVRDLQSGLRYLVYWQYGLEPSAEASLTGESDVNPGPGHWVVKDETGRINSRFADWPEADGSRGASDEG